MAFMNGVFREVPKCGRAARKFPATSGVTLRIELPAIDASAPVTIAIAEPAAAA
jgi:hypothetical protein